MKEAMIESKSKWKYLESALENYLASGFGTDRLLLSYITHERETPDPISRI